MAKDTTKKKKPGIVHRMMFGNENKPDLTPEQAKMTRWEMFKFLFISRFGTMVALNLLTMLFALPAALVIVLFYMNVTVNNGYIPYSGNLGIGYNVVVDAVQQGVFVEFLYNLYQYSALIPCIGIFALGFSGNLYVVRKLMWQEPTSTIRDFFRGIKKCWVQSLFIGFAFGFTLLLFTFSLGYFDAYGLPVALKAVCITLSSIVLVFVSLFTAFFLTQNAAFEMRFTVLMRNSALFVLATNIQSIIFIGIAVAPALLSLIPAIQMLVIMLFAFIGFSFASVVMSVYTHYCYEKFLYDKIDRSSSTYAKRKTDIEEAREQARSKKTGAATPYKNPKKRKKSIDEGASITPLAPTFRREDLERLQKEHEAVLDESNVGDDTDTDADAPKVDDNSEPDIAPNDNSVADVDTAPEASET